MTNSNQTKSNVEIIDKTNHRIQVGDVIYNVEYDNQTYEVTVNFQARKQYNSGGYRIVGSTYEIVGAGGLPDAVVRKVREQL